MSLIEQGKFQTSNESSSKSFYYSPVPMLLLDRESTVVEANCALRELMKTDVTLTRGQNLHKLLAQSKADLRGSLSSFNGFAAKSRMDRRGRLSGLGWDNHTITEHICHYHSSAFGRAKLRSVDTPLIDISTGDVEGAILSIEVVEIEHLSRYQDALRKRIMHELMWELYAVSYDRILPELPFYREVLNRHVAAMSPSRILNILDLGSGTGNVALPLLRRGKTITAVDSSKAMLKKFYSKLEKKDWANLFVVEDTAERLPNISNACFDGVTVLLALFDMQDPFSALQEAIRKLKSGGTLIITEPKSCFDVAELMAFAENHLQEKGLMEHLKEDWNRIRTVAPQINEKIQEVQSSIDVAPEPWNAELLYQILVKKGFSDLTFEDSHLGNCATIKGVKP